MKIKHRSPVKYGCKEKAYTHRSKKQTHRWKKKERLYITVTLNVSLFAPAHKNAADWIIRPRLFFVLLLDVDICHRPPKASGHHCRAFVTFTVFFFGCDVGSIHKELRRDKTATVKLGKSVKLSTTEFAEWKQNTSVKSLISKERSKRKKSVAF